MSFKSGFYKGRLGIGLANNGGDGTGNPRFPLDVNGDIRLTGSLLRSDGTPYLGGGLINYIPKGIKSVVNNDGGYFVGFGTHTPTEALDISGNLKVSGQILSVDGDDFSTVVPITQQQTTTENPTWHGDVTTTVTSSSDSASGLALKANIASPTFTTNLKIEQTGTNNNTLIINANNHNNGIDIEAFQSDSASTKKKLCFNPYGGNVGIGTTSPTQGKLVVNGSSICGIYSLGDYTDYNYILNAPRPGNTAGGAVHFINSASRTGDGGESCYTIRNDNGPIRLGKDNNITTIEGSNIILNSNVGIGTTDPGIHALRVMGTTSAPMYGRALKVSSNGSCWLELEANAGGSVEQWGISAMMGGELSFYKRTGTDSAGYRLTIKGNGNVGIGTMAPLADLHIHSETTNYKSGGKLLLSRWYGSSTDMRAGAIWMSHLDTTGWAADRMCFAVNAEDANDAGNPLDKTPQMVLQANGNVGIGTTSPGSKLEIYDDSPAGQVKDILHVKNYGGYDMVSLGTSSNFNSGQVTLYYNTTTKASANEGVVINANGDSYFYIGNVGIGTTSPGQKLHISDSGNTTLKIVSTNTNSPGIELIRTSLNNSTHHDSSVFGDDAWTDWKIYNNSSELQFQGGYRTATSGNHLSTSPQTLITVMTMLNNGNVGIGTTTPQTMLDIRGEGGGSSGGNCLTLRNGNSNNDYTGSQILFSWAGNPYNSSGYSHKIQSRHNSHTPHNDNAIDFYLWKNGQGAGDIGNTHGMSITATGVGIGTTSPTAGLHVTRTGSNSIPNGAGYLAINSSTGTWNYGTRSICIRSHGDIWLSAGEIMLTSDKRIKDNIIDVPDNLALEMLRNIPCRYYEYKDKLMKGTEKTIGFIAQEVREVLPMCVNIQKEFIPNELRILTDISWNNTTLYTDISDCSGVKYKFYVSNNDDFSDEVEKEIIGNADNSFTFDQSWNNVFCYGREVDDFHTLDKQKLFALNFSATQELDRKVTALENENAELKAELATIKAHLGI